MPRLTRRYAAISIGLALAIALPGGPTRAAEVAPARIADLTYEVYVGGLHIFSIDVEMALQPDRYRMTAVGQTEGMVGMMYSWNLQLAAEGLDRNGRIVPQRYTAHTQWRSNDRKLELGFGAGGHYELKQDPPPEPDPDIEGGLPATLPDGIVDPLSFAIAASRSLAKTGRCDQVVPVFDGQRRSNAIVKHLGPTVLPPNQYSMFQGPAVRCSLGIQRISGFRKSQRANQESGPPILWMATVQPDLPPVPVRYESEIKLGKMVVHLTKAEFRAATNTFGQN